MGSEATSRVVVRVKGRGRNVFQVQLGALPIGPEVTVPCVGAFVDCVAKDDRVVFRHGEHLAHGVVDRVVTRDAHLYVRIWLTAARA